MHIIIILKAKRTWRNSPKQTLNHPIVYEVIVNKCFKKQCISCHVMAQKSATDHLKSSITHINFI